MLIPMVLCLELAAAQQPPEEKLNVPVRSLRQVAQQLEAIKPKGEFETSSEYAERSRKEEEKIIPAKRLFVDAPMASIRYNADSQLVEIRTQDFNSWRDKFPSIPYIVVDGELTDKGMSRARANSGVEVPVKLTSTRLFALACENEDNQLGGIALARSIFFSISMTRDQARQRLAHLGLILEVDVVKPVVFNNWLDHTIEPTTAKPEQIEYRLATLKVMLRKLILFDKKTKTVVHVRKMAS